MPPKRVKPPLSFHIMFISLTLLWTILGWSLGIIVGLWPFGWIFGAIGSLTNIDFAKFAIMYLYTVPKEHLIQNDNDTG